MFRKHLICLWYALPLALLFAWVLPFSLEAGEKKGEIPVTTSSQEAYLAFTEGREAYEMGRVDDARSLMDKALKADPGFALGYLYKAYLAGSAAEWKSNLELAFQRRSSVSERENLLIEIEQAWLTKNPETRFELVKTLAGLYPGDVRALLLLAGEYQLRKQVNLYREMAHRAILTDPRSPLGYRALAVSWLFNLPIDFDLAESNMQEFAKLRPGEAIALLSVGDVCRAKIDFHKALKAYTAAIHLDPLSGIGFSKRGYINSYLGQFDDALSDFETARSFNGGGSLIGSPNNNLVSFFFSGNVKLAAEDLQKMHASLPSGLDAQNAASKGKNGNHRFCCSMIAHSHGLYTAPFAGEDECCCLQKDFTLESFPPDPETVDAMFAFVKSIRAINSENFPLASQMAEEHALLLQPGVKPGKSQVYHYLMGVISYRQKQYQRAVNHFQKSDLSNQCVKFDLALAYDQIGEFEKAEELMKDVSVCAFTSNYLPDFVKMSQSYLKRMAVLPEE